MVGRGNSQVRNLALNYEVDGGLHSEVDADPTQAIT